MTPVVKTAKLGWNIAREAGATLLTYELYPLGLAGHSVPALAPYWLRGPEQSRPVLFLHGILHNPSAFAWLVQRLALAGWRHLSDLNLFTLWHSVPKMAEQVQEHTDRLLKKHHCREIDLVAHSMGGLVARYFVQCLGGAEKVRNLVTLGTPHLGTVLSPYSLVPALRELSPRSPTLKKLAEAPLPKRTDVLSISGALDVFIQPKSHALWPGTRNVEMEGLGHAGLLFSRRVSKLLIAQLNDQMKS